MTQNISLTPLKKASARFNEFKTNMQDDRDKAGAIQAFEFCYELSWKTLKKLLESRGVLDLASPKKTFIKAAQEGIITNVEVWIVFLETRNLTVHTYDEKVMDEVVEVFETFAIELEKLIIALEKNING